MKKIGLLTYYNNYNYGSYLQSFALINAIRSLGFEPFLIDFNNLSKPWNRRLYIKTIFNRLRTLFLHPSLILETLKTKKVKNYQLVCSSSQKTKFDDFLNNCLPLFKADYTKFGFDAFIVGSDQVWKLTLPGLHYALFLRFAEPSKRISYAASIGNDFVPSYNKRLFRIYIKDFCSISVREAKTVSLINEIVPNISVEHVLDPVLLIGREFWEDNISGIDYQNYILLYFLDPINNCKDIIHQILLMNPNKKLLAINTGIDYSDLNASVVDPSPLEFVSLFRNCSVAITDSFHGTAFSLIFEKDFYTLPRSYKIFPGQKERLISLLNLFICEDHYIENCNDVVNASRINYNRISQILHSKRTNSINYLKSAILKSTSI